LGQIFGIVLVLVSREYVTEFGRNVSCEESIVSPVRGYFRKLDAIAMGYREPSEYATLMWKNIAIGKFWVSFYHLIVFCINDNYVYQMPTTTISFDENTLLRVDLLVISYSSRNIHLLTVIQDCGRCLLEYYR